MAGEIIDLRNGEQEVITSALVRQIGAHAMLQPDGSIRIGWGSPPDRNFIVTLKFKDGKFDMIEMSRG